MLDRRAAAPTTVVNWFTVGYQPHRATRELARTAQFLRRQPGFDFLLRARLVSRPNVYVQLGYWQRHADFVAAVARPSFDALMERLSALDVSTSADQTVSIARVGSAPGRHDPTHAVGFLTEYLAATEHTAMECALRAQVDSYRAWSAFGGTDVLRSIVRPSRYLSVSWWFDARQCQAAIRAAGALPATVLRAQQTRYLVWEPAVGRPD